MARRTDCYKEAPLVQGNMTLITNPVLIVEVASQRIMDVNDAAVAFTGYPRSELIRKTLSDIYTPETVALIQESCHPRHIGHGTSAICKIGRGALRTRTGRSEGVELYCQLVQERTPSVLVENRPLIKRM